MKNGGGKKDLKQMKGGETLKGREVVTK